jgi:aminoglycoside/choline kinase family phosphotransferase
MAGGAMPVLSAFSASTNSVGLSILSTWRMPMQLDNPLDDTWKTYATVYLKSVSDEAKKDFAGRSDAEKKVILRDYVKKNTAQTKEAKDAAKLLLRLLRDRSVHG